MRLQSEYCRCHHEERAYCPDKERTVMAAPLPSPTRCDCRFTDDGADVVCGVHSPPPVIYYDDTEENR